MWTSDRHNCHQADTVEIKKDDAECYCNYCGDTWDSTDDFWDAHWDKIGKIPRFTKRESTHKPKPKPTLGVSDTSVGEYISDGRLQADLDKLTVLVASSTEASMAREILKQATNIVDGKSYSAALRDVMDFLQNLVTVTEHMEERIRE